ncbi:unnamed protein product [Rhodiola kirilowii]
MKRLSSSDSLGALIPICPNSDEQSQKQEHGYNREFQTMLDGLDSDGCVEEYSGGISEKKRRLSLTQVKALERNFEVENKLEPERKVKLAQELGLQPRQVAVWFQNRRSRWKNKQLERNYGVLKSNYENLKINFDSLQRDKDSLLKEVRIRKLKHVAEKTSSESSKKRSLIYTKIRFLLDSQIRDLKSKLNQETLEHGNNFSVREGDEKVEDGGDDTELIVSEPGLNESASATLNDNGAVVSLFRDFKEGFTSSADSCYSSVILNDSKGSPNGAVSTNKVVLQKLILGSESHPENVKMEVQSLFGDEESCDFFSEEQAPTLHWYWPDQWT